MKPWGNMYAKQLINNRAAESLSWFKSNGVLTCCELIISDTMKLQTCTTPTKYI